MKTIKIGPHVKIDLSGDGFAVITDERNGWVDFNPDSLRALCEALRANLYPHHPTETEARRRAKTTRIYAVDCDGSIIGLPTLAQIFKAELSHRPTIEP